MKKEIVCAVLSSVILLCGCNSKPLNTDNSSKETETEIVSVLSQDSEPVTDTAPSNDTEPVQEFEGLPDELSIEIINATDAPNGVYFKSLACSLDGENGIKATQEQMDYIVSFIRNIEEPSFEKDIEKCGNCYSEVSDEHAYLGRIEIRYYLVNDDGDKKYQHPLERNIFDEFPEGYEDFIKLMNELDTDEEIILGEPLTVTAELVQNVLGYTDDLVDDGTLDEVIQKYPVDVYHLMKAFNNDAYLLVNSEVSYKEIIWYWPMFRVLPTEIKNVQSTETEYQAYVEAVAKAFGADPSEITDYRYGGKYIPSQNIVVYRSCDIFEEMEYSDTMPLHLVHHCYLDGGELDKDERYAIFYSPDGKFVIAIARGCLEKSYYSDCLEPNELNEYYLKITDLVG